MTTIPRTTVRSKYGYDEHGVWRPVDGAGLYIARREAFDAGNLTGTHYCGPDYGIGTGELTAELAERFRADVARSNAAGHVSMYVVRSYDTPIAWQVGDERPVMPRTRYSLTTSNHQSIARGALDVGGYVEVEAGTGRVEYVGEGKARRSGRSPYGERKGWW